MTAVSVSRANDSINNAKIHNNSATTTTTTSTASADVNGTNRRRSPPVHSSSSETDGPATTTSTSSSSTTALRRMYFKSAKLAKTQSNANATIASAMQTASSAMCQPQYVPKVSQIVTTLVQQWWIYICAIDFAISAAGCCDGNI